MAVIRSPFGSTPDGKAIERLTVTGTEDLSISFITYGATVTSVVYKGTDVVLGYPTAEGYLNGGGSVGVTVGRYANRIANGKFPLNGKIVDVGCNETGRGHLHGGKYGFEKQVWEMAGTEDTAATLRYISADGEMGYPGRLTVSVRFAVEPDNTFSITYTAVSDKDTVLNLTNHSYFNLNQNGGTVNDTVLQIFADAILPVDEKLIPTGERLDVTGTPFDFRLPRPIGKSIDDEHEQLRLCGGYDHTFVLGETCEYRLAAIAHSPQSGIRMKCYTDQPGVQLYTANFLNNPNGKNGDMKPREAFCLETQHFPDSPNHPDFPTTVLRADEPFSSVTRYCFS